MDGRALRQLKRYESNERRTKARELKQTGKTYSEIAQVMGISRQRVQQLVTYSPNQAAELIKRSNGICEICHKKAKRLDIHHTNYLTGDFVVACNSCHKKLHPNPRKVTSMYKFPITITMTEEETKLLDQWATEEGLVNRWPNRSAMVRRLIQDEYRRRNPYTVLKVEENPHPVDGESIPVVYIQES